MNPAVQGQCSGLELRQVAKLQVAKLSAFNSRPPMLLWPFIQLMFSALTPAFSDCSKNTTVIVSKQATNPTEVSSNSAVCESVFSELKYTSERNTFDSHSTRAHVVLVVCSLDVVSCIGNDSLGWSCLLLASSSGFQFQPLHPEQLLNPPALDFSFGNQRTQPPQVPILLSF